MGAKIELEGQSFGRLTVIREDTLRSNKGKVRWACKCNCNRGEEIIVLGNSLLSGRTKSCGCLHKEVTSELKTKHGLSKHPLYGVWSNMKMRCINTKNKDYGGYGGRGITVSNTWINSFEDFYRDVIKGYKEGLELDRIDNDKGYSKENCRWVTPQQNSMNKRSRKNSSSKYKGVCWNKSNKKWVANIKKDGKLKHLGYFTCEKEAASTYNKAALQLFGEYACLNKVD